MGAITAHYGVEGQGFYGIPLDKYSALCDHAHVAPADCHLLDCDLMAGYRTLCRSGGQWTRTEVSATRA